jgi:alanine dehydrogenase
MIGAGKQAIGQLEAVCNARPIREARVYSRNPERAQKFCQAMSSRLGIALKPAPTAAEAVRPRLTTEIQGEVANSSDSAA